MNGKNQSHIVDEGAIEEMPGYFKFFVLHYSRNHFQPGSLPLVYLIDENAGPRVWSEFTPQQRRDFRDGKNRDKLVRDFLKEKAPVEAWSEQTLHQKSATRKAATRKVNTNNSTTTTTTSAPYESQEYRKKSRLSESPSQENYTFGLPPEESGASSLYHTLVTPTFLDNDAFMNDISWADSILTNPSNDIVDEFGNIKDFWKNQVGSPKGGNNLESPKSPNKEFLWQQNVNSPKNNTESPKNKGDTPSPPKEFWL